MQQLLFVAPRCRSGAVGIGPDLVGGQTNRATPPASRRACVCSPLLPVCVSLTRVRLRKRLQEGNVIFIGPTRLFSGLLPSLCFMETFVSALVLLAALKEKKSFHPARIWWGLFFFSFFAVVVVRAKITTGFQGSVVRRKRRCCWVTMLSQNCPGNVGLPFGQWTVMQLFHRCVPRQRPHWSRLVEAFLRDVVSDGKSLSSCQELIHVSLYMESPFSPKNYLFGFFLWDFSPLLFLF